MSPVVRRSMMLFLAVAVGCLASLTVARAAEKAQAPKSAGSSQVAPPAATPPAIPENADELATPPAGKGTAVSPSAKPRVALTPMMAEIQALQAEREEMIAAKARTFSKAAPADAVALQAELAQMKRALELDVLRVQSRWARKENRAIDADRIDAVIEEILNPKVRIAPESRPTPDASTHR